jgi:hypothetical protein
MVTGGAQGAAAAAAPEGILGTGISTGSTAADTALGGQAIGGGMSGVQQGIGALQQAKNTKAQNKVNAINNASNAVDLGQAAGMANTLYGGPEWAGKFADGGEVHLKSGQFVIPADIVSALGNGDTGAGQKFLVDFFKDQA